MNVVTVTVVFLVAAGLLSLWFRRQSTARAQEFAAIGRGLDLHLATGDLATQNWVENCPSFRFLASGTNQRAQHRLIGSRSGTPFEIVRFRTGSQTTSGAVTEYVIFSVVAAPHQSPSFSLVPTLTLEKRLARADATIVPMAGWTSLEKWSLWMHNDATNVTASPVSSELLVGVSALIDEGKRARVELLGGHFVVYERQQGAVTQASVEQLIDNGFRLLATLR